MSNARKHASATEAADTDWVSLTEAARLLGTHRETVLKLALKGHLELDHRGTFTFVSRASIERYQRAQAPTPATD